MTEAEKLLARIVQQTDTMVDRNGNQVRMLKPLAEARDYLERRKIDPDQFAPSGPKVVLHELRKH